MNYISIDIGSRYIHSSVYKDGERHLIHTFSTVDSFSIPSTAYIKDGKILVGYEADIWSRYLPENTFEPSDTLQGQFSAYLQSVLRYIKELATRQLGEKEYELVYITPVSYYDSDPRKQIIREIAKALGFCDVKFKKHGESICSAYKFTSDDRILVCDYGYTYFKASLFHYDNDDFVFMRCNVSESYSGMYSDSIIRLIIEETAQIEYLDGAFSLSQSRAIDDLCIKVKEELSYIEQIQYPVPFTDTICLVKRKDFEKRIFDAVCETIKESSALVSESGVTWDNINAIILTGGACMSPCIPQIWKKHIAAYSNNTKLILPISSEQAVYGASLNAFTPEKASVEEGGVTLEL